MGAGRERRTHDRNARFRRSRGQSGIEPHSTGLVACATFSERYGPRRRRCNELVFGEAGSYVESPLRRAKASAVVSPKRVRCSGHAYSTHILRKGRNLREIAGLGSCVFGVYGVAGLGLVGIVIGRYIASLLVRARRIGALSNIRQTPGSTAPTRSRAGVGLPGRAGADADLGGAGLWAAARGA